MTSTTGTQTARSKEPANEPASEPQSQESGVVPRKSPTGYGLPCAKCKTYYPASMKCCPICKGGERVSPTAAAESVRVAPPENMPDPDTLEAEREKFLREFKSQLLSSPMQVDPGVNSSCVLGENHASQSAPASICQACFDRLQERADVMEAALHMDLQEATQVVYEAVWADASDPTKTYQNAAQALLSELRKRAGISLVLGPFQPLTH
ncbi:MAG TPA: hypothetical protein VFA68_20990 [Terriglobales bacterium]|nr:hypothetical protein [Terriglobales bacterium]